jgi:hypothetical protein
MEERAPSIAENEAVPRPAAAGAPPRRPPTAVGAGDADNRGQPWRERGLAELIREVVGALAMPIAHAQFSSEVHRVLREAGVVTMADLLRVSDARMKRLGIDAETRKYIVEWRRSLRVTTTGR